MKPVWIIALFTATAVVADVWHVPEDVPTIQTALDTLNSGDSVLVSAGVYHEALQAPEGLSFVLIGVVDSTAEPFTPVVDPSPLEGSRGLACLNLPAAPNVTIENFGFRNGPEMYPRIQGDPGYPGNPAGGIINSGAGLTLRQCRFDSTYRGLLMLAGTLNMDRCQFVDNVGICVLDLGAGAIAIRHGSFSGTSLLLSLMNDALVESCAFSQPTSGGEWLNVFGSGITIRDCIFAHGVSPFPTVIWGADLSGCLIERNKFTSHVVYTFAVQLRGVEGDTIRVIGNEFREIHAQTLSGALYVQGPLFVIRENLFDHCYPSAFNGSYGALTVQWAEAVIERNRFIGTEDFSRQVWVFSSPNAVIHNCAFEELSATLRCAESDTINAEFNWWGDSTGPWHETLNPEGQGNHIFGDVDFEPWLMTNPFADTTEAVPNPPLRSPADFGLDAYPNPFNAEIMLNYALPIAAHVELTLYDLLGRELRSLVNTTMPPGTHRFHLSAAELPSGTYFVRLNTTHQSIVRKLLLLR